MITIANIEEKIIKTLIIDFIIEEYNDIKIILPEFSYLLGNRRADVLAIIENKSIVFEIKSKNDSLSRLHEQINDYQNTFNEVYVVLDIKFRNSPAIKSMNKRYGLLFYDGTKIIKKRKAKTKKKLSKENIVKFLTDFPKQKDYSSIYEYRSFLTKNYPYEKLHTLTIDFIINKYFEGYKTFLSEKGAKTTLHDLEIFRFQEKDNFSLLVEEA